MMRWLVVGLLFCSAAAADETIVVRELSLPDGRTIAVGRDDTLGRMVVEIDGAPINLTHEDRTNLYLQDAFTFDGRAYVLAYDVVANIPSGRRLVGTAEANGLYELTVAETGGTLSQVAAMPAGIDISAMSADFAGMRLECAQTACLLLSKDFFGSVKFDPVSSFPGELVELATDGSAVFGLFQTTFNDQVGAMPAADASIFSVCRIEREVEGCEEVPADVVPYRLSVESERPAYETLSSQENATDLFAFDLDRLRGGLANYAEPNLEARLVWSNVYLLNGLISVATGQTGDWGGPGLRAELTERLRRELEAVVRIGSTTYPGFAVKRYTLDREPATFLLHLGRLARTFARAEALLPDIAASGLDLVRGQIESPSQTVEVLAPGAVEYRRYQPFWADGSNVPWNYQSGWIEGAALAGFIDPNREYIADRLADFVTTEKLAEHPSKWNYAGGVFFNGWSDGVSANTPTYRGDYHLSIPAHISYRSMDALAVLASEDAGVVSYPGMRDYFAGLVTQGYLYPFVSEALEEPSPIPFHVARHYARAYLPWHVQNQPWALNAIVSDNLQ